MIRAIEREHRQAPGWWESLNKEQQVELWAEWNVRAETHNAAIRRARMGR